MSSNARFAVCTALAFALTACSDYSNSPDNAPPASATVTATAAQAFSPQTIRVATGGTITWKFESVGHNVIFDAVTGAPANIPGSNSNTNIARTFATNGTFPYHCTIHPGMTGTVQVTASTATPTDGGNNAPLPGY